ncbi:MAG: hypothetical protein KJO40_04065, partial [Deltaproteobacteria bacterium]|nr:hypothetical protein [Deltaproteobacteria bacterium]
MRSGDRGQDKALLRGQTPAIAARLQQSRVQVFSLALDFSSTNRPLGAFPSVACMTLLPLIALGCADSPATQVVVLMETDYGVPDEVDRIEASVSKMIDTGSGLEEVETWRSTFALSDDASSQPGLYRLPATFSVLPAEADVGREIVIRLAALGIGTDQALVSRRVRTGFVAGEIRLVRMALYRACAGVSCSDGETCGCSGPSSCAEPACVTEVVRPGDLERISNPGTLPEGAGIPVSDGGLPDGSVPDGGGGTCEPPLLLCGTSCVDPQVDPSYCGSCEIACSTGDVCEAGSCIDAGDCRVNGVGCAGFTYCDETTGECLRGCGDDSQCVDDAEECDTVVHECVCTLGFHLCGAVCVDDLDVNSCGDRCAPCPAPPNATAVCDLGTCDFVCDETHVACGQLCCPTSCPPGQALYQGACAEVHVRVVDDVGNVGEFSSIALDAAGKAQIAYYASSGRDLAHAAQREDGTWSFRRPDGGDEVGEHASIAVDPDGVAHVAYYNSSKTNLMLATNWAGVIWTVQTVDDSDGVGEYASLAFDSDGDPHISYYDRDNKDLMYATRGGVGPWAIETVDSKDDVGEYTSLALSPSGAVHISYYDADGNSLKYASQELDGSWRTQTVDSVGDTGRFTSLAFDPTGVPHISYYAATGRNLRLASSDDEGAWTSKTVESAGDVGKYSSLAFDENGGAHISYFNEGFRNLKYAFGFPGEPWLLRTIDSAGDVGRYTSCGVDTLGQA